MAIYLNPRLVKAAISPQNSNTYKWIPYAFSVGEVGVHAGLKVSAEADDYNVLIVGNPQGIFDQQLRGQFAEQKLVLCSSFRCDQIYLCRSYDFVHILLCLLSQTLMLNEPTSGLSQSTHKILLKH